MDDITSQSSNDDDVTTQSSNDDVTNDDVTNNDDAEMEASEDADSPPGLIMDYGRIMEDSDDDSNNNNDDEEDELHPTALRQRKNNTSNNDRKRHSSSSSSSASTLTVDEDSEDDDDDEEKKPRKSREEMERDEEMWLKRDLLELPIPKWNPVRELTQRQIGNQLYSFTQKVRSSRAMVERLQLDWELKQHQGCVNALHFNDTGTLLASGSDDLKVMLWDWSQQMDTPLVAYHSGHRSNVFQTKFLPNSGDSTVISSARDGQVRLANISSTGVCRDTRRLAQHRGSAHKLALNSDGCNSTFLSCGEDGVVFGVDVRCEKAADKLVTVKVEGKKIPLYSVHCSPSQPSQFAVSGREPQARVYDRRNMSDVVKTYCPQHLLNVSGFKANITCLVYNWDGSELLCSYNDEDVYLFDTSHSQGADYIKRYKGHRNNATVKGVNFFGSNSQYVVSGSDCGNIFFWEKQSSQIVHLVEGDKGGVVNVIEPHPNLPVLATSGLDSEVKIWTPSQVKRPYNSHKLKELMLSNLRERLQDREDRESMPDTFQSHLLWFLMRTLRNRQRSSQNDSSEEGDDDESLSSISSSSSSEDDDQDELVNPIRCPQS